MNKRYFCLVVVYIFIFANSFAVATPYERDIPKVDENEKVYDFADLFTDTEESLLYDEITDFIFESNLDMAVVTIDDNPKNSAMNYADDFYDYNKFGIGSTYDGLLFLIDMDTREMWISTTGTAQVIYDNNRINRILNDAYYKIVDEDYYACASKFVEKSQYYFGLGIPSSNKNAGINENGDYIYNFEGSALHFNEMFLPLGAFSLIVALIIVFIMKGRHKTIKKATTAWSYMHSPSITYREDTFLTTNTVRTYIPPSNSSSGGGSSTHRGSSGRSHGGGGRRF